MRRGSGGHGGWIDPSGGNPPANGDSGGFRGNPVFALLPQRLREFFWESCKKVLIYPGVSRNIST